MCFKVNKERSFNNIALAIIFIGIAIFAFGIVARIYNVVVSETVIAFPSLKILGGIIAAALGYIILELEFLRKK